MGILLGRLKRIGISMTLLWMHAAAPLIQSVISSANQVRPLIAIALRIAACAASAS
jgi:hypothetical protein